MAIIRSIAAVLALGAAALAARGQGVRALFEADGRAARSAIVTAGDHLPPDRPPDAPMLDRLAGVLATLDAREVARLRQAAEPWPPEDAGFASGRRIGVLHLQGPATTARTELLWAGDGTLLARGLDGQDAPAARLDLRALGDLMIEWDAPLPSEPGGEPERWPGRVLFTDAVTTQRYLGPGRSRGASGLPPMQRTLADERFETRLPKGHTDARPAGVLVWISPRPDPWMDQLEPIFGPTLDELGLILVAPVNAGNDRPILDRLQLAFDALESVRRARLVDDDRVYVTGMSGGGRCASILLCTFPEVFAGAVPIVGLNSWHVVHLPDGGYFPRQIPIARPERLALLRDRRLRAITGDSDENAFEMRERTRMLAEDGVQAVLDDYPDMGHTMPTPERFALAMRWVDGPARGRAAEREARGRALLEAHDAAHGRGPPESDAARESLIEITRQAPWTAPAWAAARRLGHTVPPWAP